MSDEQCRGHVSVRWKPTGRYQLNLETGEFEPLYEAITRRCARTDKSLNLHGYCWQHRDQGEYEEEIESAYAQHTAVY